VEIGRKPKLTPHQKREAIKRRDKDGETLRSGAKGANLTRAGQSTRGRQQARGEIQSPDARSG
jgi:hypothetical protein